MVFLEHRPRVYYSLTTAVEATALFVQHVKGAIYCERTATVTLPTAASPGFISGEVGISADLDAFSTVYELPLTRFKKGQTDKHTAMNDHYTSLCATPTRGKMIVDLSHCTWNR